MLDTEKVTLPDIKTLLNFSPYRFRVTNSCTITSQFNREKDLIKSTKTLQVRVKDELLEALEKYCLSNTVSISEGIREGIQLLTK